MSKSNPPNYEEISSELINLAQRRSSADRERVKTLLSLLNEKSLRKGLQGKEFEAIEASKSYLRTVPEE